MMKSPKRYKMKYSQVLKPLSKKIKDVMTVMVISICEGQGIRTVLRKAGMLEMARFRNLPVIQGLQNLTTAIQSLVRLMVSTLIKAAKNSLPHLRQITVAALKTVELKSCDILCERNQSSQRIPVR